MGPHLPLRILFIVPYAPSRIRTRPFHLIKALAGAGHRVTLGTLWTNCGELAALRALNIHLESTLTERISSGRTIWNCIRALPSSYPVQAHYSWSPALARRILRAINRTDFDVIHVEHLRGVRYALLLENTDHYRGTHQVPVVWDSVDCITELFRHAAVESQAFRSRLTSMIELPRTERCEGYLATRFQRILVTSEADRRCLVTMAEYWKARHASQPSLRSEERIVVLPNGVDLDYFSPMEGPREPATLVISGKMSYHANVTAVVRFARDVMPRIWAYIPETRLWIAGSNPAREILRLGVPWSNGGTPRASSTGGRDSRIRITGTVEDIRPYLRKATVAVAPIEYGVGIQNKVLEAMACGTPVIATPQAVTALEAQALQAVRVAGNPQELADSIISLLRNGQQCSELGRAGRRYVEEQHDWGSIVHDLVRVYKDAKSWP